MKPSNAENLQCREARAAIQVLLDEPLPSEQETALCKHVSKCDACATYQADLGAMRQTLRFMPLFELPTEVRDDVQSAVAGRDAPREWLSRGFVGPWRRAVIAAVLVLAVGGSWWAMRSPGPHYSDVEVARAAEDLELALALAGAALGEVERITLEDVLAQRVLPAMRQLPVRWPTSAETPADKGGSNDDQ